MLLATPPLARLVACRTTLPAPVFEIVVTPVYVFSPVSAWLKVSPDVGAPVTVTFVNAPPAPFGFRIVPENTPLVAAVTPFPMVSVAAVVAAVLVMMPAPFRTPMAVPELIPFKSNTPA